MKWISEMITDEDILKLFYLNDRCLTSHCRKSWLVKHPDIQGYLEKRFKDTKDIKEVLYRIHHQMEVRPTCAQCGGLLVFRNNHYETFCSQSCAKRYTKSAPSNEDFSSLLDENGEPNNNRLQDKYLLEHGLYHLLDNIGETRTEKLYNQLFQSDNKCEVCGGKAYFLNFRDGYKKRCERHEEYSENEIERLFFRSGEDKPISRKNLDEKYSYAIRQLRPDTKSLREGLYQIHHGMTSRPLCNICGNQIEFNDLSFSYNQTCSIACAMKLTALKRYKDLGYDATLKDNMLVLRNCCPIHGDVTISQPTFRRRMHDGSKMCQICYDADQSNPLERFVYDVLGDLNLRYETHNRKILRPQELDIYIEEHNLAIEINGTYWHSSQVKKPNYHFQKRERCERIGIRLLSLYEDDILYRPELVKKLIVSKLKPEQILGVTIKDVDLPLAEKYIKDNYLYDLDIYHSQGIFKDTKLVGVLVMDHDGLNYLVSPYKIPEVVASTRNLVSHLDILEHEEFGHPPALYHCRMFRRFRCYDSGVRVKRCCLVNGIRLISENQPKKVD